MMKAIFKPALAALVCLALTANGARLKVMNNMTPVQQPEQMMLAQGNSCSSENPTYGSVMGDLRQVFAQYATRKDSNGNLAMDRDHWVEFCNHFGLLDTTVNKSFGKEKRARLVYSMATAQKTDGWMWLTFEQFITSLNMVGVYRRQVDPYGKNPEDQKDRNTFSELVAWVTGSKGKQVKSVTFHHTEKYSNLGGSKGTQEFSTIIKKGRSTKHQITHHAIAAVEAAIHYENILSPVKGDVVIKGQYDFNNYSEYANDYESTYTEKLTVDLSKPIYVYQKGVTIEYQNGERETIYCGKVITSEPEPLHKKVDKFC